MTANPRILALFGGAAVFGQELGNIEALAALRDGGCDVLCLVRDEAWSVHVTPALDARGLRWRKVPYIEHRLPGRLHYLVFRNPVAFMRANREFFRVIREFRPTHIHAFSPAYVLNFLIGLTVVRLPMVYRAGDAPTVHNFLWRALWRFVVWRADRFVANSRFVAKTLRDHGVAKKPITVIYNAPPVHTRTAKGLPPLADHPGAFRVAFVGQVSPHKGVHVLVDAFRVVAGEFPSAFLVIAGRISDWVGDAWARELRDRTAADLLLAMRISFIGEIDDVPTLLSGSAVHVAPSLFDDPSPNVVMEAKQSGRPSIVFSKGGMPELVQDGVDGIVCREPTAECLADALRRYLRDPALAARHGQAALASLARLGVPEFRERWLDVYAGVLPKQDAR